MIGHFGGAGFSSFEPAYYIVWFSQFLDGWSVVGRSVMHVYTSHFLKAFSCFFHGSEYSYIQCVISNHISHALTLLISNYMLDLCIEKWIEDEKVLDNSIPKAIVYLWISDFFPI